MSGHVKILQLNSNLSKLIDSLCFELTVNKPDSNSLSLLQIIEWKNNDEISQQQFRQLYLGWLQSKNIHDLFSQKQIKTYPKQDLIQFQGPIKRFLSINEITKTLEILNALYNEQYIKKNVKLQIVSSKAELIRSIQQTEKLFSILDSNGIINLRLNQIFFLTASILIIQNKPIPLNFQQMKQFMKKNMKQMSQIDGKISLRAFKNYFLSKSNNKQLKGIILVLQEIQNSLNLQKDLKQKKQINNSLPQILQESIMKWKAYPKFKNKQKKIEFLKRMFEQNQKFIYFHNSETNNLYQQLLKKYGQQLIDCVQIDKEMLNQFMNIHEQVLAKYINLIQRTSSVINKNIKNTTPRYIDQLSSNTYIGYNNNKFESSIKKKISSNTEVETAKKNISKTPTKDRTPQKLRKNVHDFTAPNYKNRTPTNKAYTQVHNEFGSAEKKNTSAYIASGRQTTPTKSTLSFATDAPRTYRAAQKKGLQQNNFYDKLFFFRNKRVQSYEIVMKRLKNK